MNKLPNFPKEDQEKKQLEEIAHLYFSEPSTAGKSRKDLTERAQSVSPFLRLPEALFVYCPAGPQEAGLSTWFLFNLAVMLKILNGPVLLIGSEQSYEKRFLFGFRPDRERLALQGRPSMPSRSFGPMGVCLLDGRSLAGEGAVPLRGYEGAPRTAGHVSFRYILSDEARTGGWVRSIPCLAVLLVTPATLTTDLLGRESEEGGDFVGRLSSVGVVVAGASCTEEADALYRYWRDKLEARCERDVVVENFGMLPDEALPPGLGFRSHGKKRVLTDGLVGEVSVSNVDILDSPLSAAARFCRTTAALIRKKRSELISRFAQ